MIRAAAKNYQDIAVVVSPSDYESILSELRASEHQLSRETCWKLALKAWGITAAYDQAVSARLSESKSLDLNVPHATDLRYGENPHQSATLYAFGNGGIAGAKQLHGKELSYNNLVDLDAAWQLVQEFTRPAAAIIKHQSMRLRGAGLAGRGLPQSLRSGPDLSIWWSSRLQQAS